jgi:hypothetical protein
MKRVLLVSYGALLLAALGSYALLGWHVRMLADDYCQFGVGLHHGTIGAVILFSSVGISREDQP